MYLSYDLNIIYIMFNICILQWSPGDFIISDNLAVAHWAMPDTQLPASEVGLRIMHRTVIKGVYRPRKPWDMPPDGAVVTMEMSGSEGEDQNMCSVVSNSDEVDKTNCDEVSSEYVYSANHDLDHQEATTNSTIWTKSKKMCVLQ